MYWNINTHISSLWWTEALALLWLINKIKNKVSLTYQLLQSVGTMSPGLYCSPSTSQRHSDSRTHTPSWKDGRSTIWLWLLYVYGLWVCVCVGFSNPTHLLDSSLWTLAARSAVPAQIHCEVCAWHYSPHTLLPLLAWGTHPAISWHSNRGHAEINENPLSVIQKTPI